jgi:carotenoid cleavage dioxygenase
MAKFIPIPWMQWRTRRISGVVLEHESKKPLPGLMVNAMDKDIIKDDFLGQCETDAEGRFEIRFSDADFKDFGEAHPDIYLTIYRPGHAAPIHDTSHEIRHEAGDDEHFEITISKAHLG